MGMRFSILSRPKNSIYQSGRLFLLAIFLTFLFLSVAFKNRVNAFFSGNWQSSYLHLAHTPLNFL